MKILISSIILASPFFFAIFLSSKVKPAEVKDYLIIYEEDTLNFHYLTEEEAFTDFNQPKN